MTESYTLFQLESCPTLSESHSMDLKVESYETDVPGADGIRVWLDRSPAEEIPYAHVEHLRNGRWIDAERYIPEFPTLPDRIDADGITLLGCTFDKIVRDFSEGSENHRWRVVIGRTGNDSPMEASFHNSEHAGGALPELSRVLSGLLGDAGDWISSGGDFRAYVNEAGISFGDGAEERAARKSFEGCKRTAEALRELLGEEKLNEYLYRTEDI